MKYIIAFSLIFFFLMTNINAQTIKKIVFNGEQITIYRLDESQKRKIEQTEYSKYKKQNAAFINEVLNSYSKLEEALDAKSLKEAEESLRMIDFRLGSDAPNLNSLREEYNIYITNEILNNNKESRKRYVDSIIKNSKKVF